MLKIENKVFEKVIIKMIRAMDMRELVREFSKDRIFFFSLLNDISRGKDSPNYQALKKVARDEKIGEKFIVEQAKFLLTYFAPYEPKEDYYRILNVSHTDSAEDIKKSWLGFMKIHHPDKVGQDGLDITKKFNEAYEVLSDPKKRIEYDAKRLPVLPVVVCSVSTEGAPGRYIYMVSLTFFIFTIFFFLAEANFLFRSSENKREFIGVLRYKIEESKIPISDLPQVNNKTLPTEPERVKKQSASPALKEKEEFAYETEALRDEQKVNNYIVKKGDSLWEIARRFNTSVKYLRTASNLKNNRLDIGDVLIIPIDRQKVDLVREDKELRANGF